MPSGIGPTFGDAYTLPSTTIRRCNVEDRSADLARDCLLKLATPLGDSCADPDDLIHAFGEVEQNRAKVASLVLDLLMAGLGMDTEDNTCGVIQ